MDSLKLIILILLFISCDVNVGESNPDKILLWQNSPNPFTDSTKIRFYNPEYQFIIVFITDGEEAFVQSIHSGYTDEGDYKYWIGGDYSSDVYYVRLVSSDNIQRRTMLKIGK